MDGTTHDGAGTDDGHLGGQVVQVGRAGLGQDGGLGPGLDLEDPDSVRPVDAVVDGAVRVVDAGQVDQGLLVDGHQVQALLDQGQHAEGQHVDLHHAGVVYRVLVPLADIAPGPGRRLEGDTVHQGVRGDDHSPYVLGDVAGEVGQLVAEVDQVAPARRPHQGGELGRAQHLLPHGAGRPPPLGLLGQAVQLGPGQAQGLAHVPYGGADPVAGEGGDQGGVVGAPAAVHGPEQPVADVAREVEVYVRQAHQVLIEEAAEEEVVAYRVDVGEADQVADHAAHAGAPPPPRGEVGPGPGRPPAGLGCHLGRQLEDLVVDEEEAGQAVSGDEGQLLVEAGGGGGLLGGLVAGPEGLVAEVGQPGVGGVAGGHGWRGEPVAEVLVQVEGGAAPGDVGGGPDGLGPGREAGGLLGGGAEVELAVGPAKLVALVQGGAVADGAEHVVEAVARGIVVVDVAGGDRGDLEGAGQIDQRPAAWEVAVYQVVV